MTGAAAMARELRYGLDAATWARECLDFEPDPWQTRVLQSSASRVLLNCTRQAGKSTTTAVLAAHTALYQPGALVLLFSKAHRQSMELFAKVAGFLRVAGAELPEDSKQSCALANGSRIISLPGDGDSVRGFSAPALVIEDESAFVNDALYQAVRPMLAVSRGRMILMSTPHGKRGHFYDAWTQGGDEWHRESVTAHDVPRIDPAWLARERAAIGEWWFRQEYCCEFVETHDQLFSEAAITAAVKHTAGALRI